MCHHLVGTWLQGTGGILSTEVDKNMGDTYYITILDVEHQYQKRLNSRAQSTYAVSNLIHTRHKQTFLVFFMWYIRYFINIKKFLNIINKILLPKSKWINPARAWMHQTLRSHVCKTFGVQLYTNKACALHSCILCIINSDRLQLARSICRVYEWLLYTGLQSSNAHLSQLCFADLRPLHNAEIFPSIPGV